MRFILALILIVNTINAANWKSFVEKLKKGEDISSFIHQDELALSKRLGITYKGVTNKTMISYEPVQPDWKNISFDYKDNKDATAQLTLRDTKQTINYYFIDDKIVSPIYYYSKDWKKAESKYFVFKSEDDSLLLEYNFNRLDNFVESIFEKLNYPAELKEKLAKEKIYYILCKDTEQITRLTGYDARGIYNLAFDYVVSTYQCHYHEIVHLLTNYRLQHLNLYTNPFLLEGLAVSLGGRGGNEPDVLLQLGAFINEAGFLDINTLLSAAGFSANDVSISYPFTGFYNEFLLNTIGADEYLKMYAQYGSKTFATLPTIPKNKLPDEATYKKYVTEKKYNTIDINLVSEENIILTGKNYTICEDDKHYYFKLKNTIGLNENIPAVTKSSKYEEIFPGNEYPGSKYLVMANEAEISLYNLYSNNLVAKYAAGFTMTGTKVEKKNGYFHFAINKKYFDGSLKELNVKEFE